MKAIAADMSYVSLRESVLLGTTPPGTVVRAEEFAARNGIGQKRARDVLNQLVEDGYLEKSRTLFTVSSWPKCQVEEWLLIYGHLSELAALRGPQGPEALSHMADIIARMKQTRVSDESFFFLGLEYFRLHCGEGPEGLAQIVLDIVPQALFRMIWLADQDGLICERPGGESLLLRAMVDAYSCFIVDDKVGARAFVVEFFEGVRSGVLRNLDLRESNANAVTGLYMPASNTIESGFDPAHKSIPKLATKRQPKMV